ncbi:MAG: phosphotransferase, partial [Myxococcota bacterium]|nr:phosphotransferase [Myxococcota bacterium]
MFTRLGDAELADIATRFGLGTVTAHQPIAAGTINSNYALVTTTGRWFVRVNEGKAEADVGWEARLVAALAATGVVTPPPLPAAEGRPYAPLLGAPGKWVSVFAWRAGRH